MAAPLELGRLAQEAAALAGAVRGCLGPRGGRALLALPSGAVVLTRDGRRLLEALSLEAPTARFMRDTKLVHVLMISERSKEEPISHPSQPFSRDELPSHASRAG